MLVSIEGNIGSGKTTILRKLKKRLSDKDFIFMEEPVDLWKSVVDEDGKDMLTKFYDNPSRYAFSFQMMAFVSRYNAIKEVVAKNPGKTVIIERSLDSGKRIFTDMLHDTGVMEDVEYQIYVRWIESLHLRMDKYIYIRTPVATAHRRCRRRGRGGEENITMDYLQRCHDYHEKWLGSGVADIVDNEEGAVAAAVAKITDILQA